MMYHKNRLIKAYHRVGCQLKVSVCDIFISAFLLFLILQLGCMCSSQTKHRKSIGVIGVIECNYLQPTHNKQDFDDTIVYR